MAAIGSIEQGSGLGINQDLFIDPLKKLKGQILQIIRRTGDEKGEEISLDRCSMLYTSFSNSNQTDAIVQLIRLMPGLNFLPRSITMFSDAGSDGSLRKKFAIDYVRRLEEKKEFGAVIDFIRRLKNVMDEIDFNEVNTHGIDCLLNADRLELAIELAKFEFEDTWYKYRVSCFSIFLGLDYISVMVDFCLRNNELDLAIEIACINSNQGIRYKNIEKILSHCPIEHLMRVLSSKQDLLNTYANYFLSKKEWCLAIKVSSINLDEACLDLNQVIGQIPYDKLNGIISMEEIQKNPPTSLCIRIGKDGDFVTAKSLAENIQDSIKRRQMLKSIERMEKKLEPL